MALRQADDQVDGVRPTVPPLASADLAASAEVAVEHEPNALKRLMGRHGTRETEVDRLLRGEVLVDLYRVVKQSLIASRESYSLKDVEALYMAPRDGAIAEGGSSIVAYESWRESHAPSVLAFVETYPMVYCAWISASTFAYISSSCFTDVGKNACPPVTSAICRSVIRA